MEILYKKRNTEVLKMALQITSENFEKEVLQSELPVMVDFYADWCGPCKMMGPVVEELATEFEGKAKVGKLNVDDCPELAAKYKVMTIPTIIVFKNGTPEQTSVGVVAKETLAGYLK